MRLYLVAVGRRPPQWIQAGIKDYLKRLPPAMAPRLIEISPSNKHLQSSEAALSEEADRIHKALPEQTRKIILDERGTIWSTREVAKHWQTWQQQGDDIALIIGGANGCADALKRSAEAVWSLSRLTFPHQLVRLIVAEQLYRAWSVLNNHPYHRD